jgi:uncharacterized Zn finger protein
MSSSSITTQLGSEGLGQQPWWVDQWMELINSYRFKKRLERAWEYARSGNVTSIRFEGRRVHARVQGTGEEPYKVKLWLDVLSDEDWGYVLDALTQKARWSAQLLAGVMPADIERAFAASGKRLFPFKLQEVRSECSCPDKANPCKHVSAVFYLMGDRFSEDPFVLFQLRGRTRPQLLADLAKRRRRALAQQAKAAGAHQPPLPDALAALRREGEPAASQLRDSLDRVQPGLGNPVMKVEVRDVPGPAAPSPAAGPVGPEGPLAGPAAFPTAAETAALQQTLARIAERLGELERRLS